MSLETKLDQILARLDVIESSLGIKKPSLWDNLKPLYNVTDTAKLLGCSVSKGKKVLKVRHARIGKSWSQKDGKFKVY